MAVKRTGFGNAAISASSLLHTNKYDMNHLLFVHRCQKIKIDEQCEQLI